jgi:hypothetical protein
MQLTVLTVPGCPNAGVLEQRLSALLVRTPGVTVTRRVIADSEDAARWGMRGSPTLLIDGRDPFSGPTSGPVIACRLYPAEDGRLEGAPTISALREALEQAAASS